MLTLVLLLGPIACGAEPPRDLSTLTARPAAEWLTRGVMYQIWLRSFTPEGTLKAAAQRLPAVAELGANVIYLSPVNLSDEDMRREFWSTRQKASGTNNPRNPYRISDYNRVDPEYGTEADLREFVATAHKLGMRVLLDLVYFHCGPTSDLLNQPDFVVRDAAGKVSTGSWNFPVLNFKSQGLREHLWANMTHWVKNFDFDGFRCDVADAVPLDFWEEARRRLEPLRSDLVILSEGQRRGDQVYAFDLNYGFSWHTAQYNVFTKGESAANVRKLWEKQTAERPRGARIMRYTENHDIVNDLLRTEVVCGERGAMALSVMNFTIDGVPLLYGGQEIGDTSLQCIYARWPVRWEAACLPKAAAKLETYKKLCGLRRNEPLLADGETVWLENDQPDSVASFLRRGKTGAILSVISLSGRKVEVQVTLPSGAAAKFAPLLAAQAEAAKSAASLAFKLGPFGYYLGKQ